MGHTYQKGTKRPGKTDNPRRHERRPQGYVLAGGVPWPTFGDGTPYADRFTRVTMGEEAGTLRSVEWCHPDGTYMPDGARSSKATKTRPERTNPGAWFAIVSWDNRETNGLAARVSLGDLVPLDPGT